jgi:hypothetical protein
LSGGSSGVLDKVGMRAEVTKMASRFPQARKTPQERE